MKTQDTNFNPKMSSEGQELQITLEDFKLIKSFYPQFSRKAGIQTNTFIIGWSEIMPLVEKIESMGFVTKSESNTVSKWFSIWSESHLNSHCIATQGNGNHIENHYKAVVEFIKWYKTQTP